MRRFKHSLLARLVSKTMALSLVVNYLGLFLLAPKAEAQLTGTLPQWAVVDFQNSSGKGGTALAGAATDAFATNLAGTNQANVVPKESVERGYRELAMNPPLTRTLDIIRLGQWLQVDTVFVGNVEQARIMKGANGKSADVVFVVRGYDVASGLPIMGAAVVGQSSERPGDVSDDTLYEEAVNYASQEAVRTIMSQQVATATIIGNPGSGKFVKLNKGSRDGLVVGQELVVTRGREQVGVIRISETDPTTADANVIKQIKGVAPGDKARVIFDKLPRVELTSGGPRVRTSKSVNTTSALLGLLVVGLLATLVVKEGGNGTGGKVVTEAGTADDLITPAVVVTYKPNIFSGDHRTRVEWHIWRSDFADNPVGSVEGNLYRFYDTPFGRTVTWRDFGGLVGGPCADDPGTTDSTGPGIAPGTTYFYQLSLVYRISCLNTPGGCDGGTVTDCFYETTRANASGSVTPVTPVQLLLPPNGATDVNTVVQFSWTSTAGATDYCVELSTTPAFNSSQSVRVAARVTSLLVGSISTDPINISGFFPGIQRLYWRVGARNAGDNPGPVKDILGERYVFNYPPNQFDRVTPPPPPPAP